MGALSRGPLMGTLSTLVGGPWWGPLVGGGGPWWGHTTTEGNLYVKERVIWDCVPREHT